MLWRTAKHCRDLVAPPRELEPRDAWIGNLVDGVVDLTAERIQRGDRAPLLRRQKAKAVVEARAALGSFLLTIGVRRHRSIDECRRGHCCPIARAQDRAAVEDVAMGSVNGVEDAQAPGNDHL